MQLDITFAPSDMFGVLVNSQKTNMLNCSFIDEERVICNGTEYMIPEQRLTWNDKAFWIYLAIYVGLVLAAGTFCMRGICTFGLN